MNTITNRRFEASYAAYVCPEPLNYWSDEKDVKKKLAFVNLEDPTAISAGGMPIISDGKLVYLDSGDLHTAIYGQSGSKKTLCFFMTLLVTLALAGENMIVTDPKGEIRDRMSGFLKKKGYSVYCLNFRTMEEDGFNILGYPAKLYKSHQEDKAMLLLNNLVNVLAAEQRAAARDPFWPNTAAQWIASTAAVMLDTYPTEAINIINWGLYNNRGTLEYSDFNRLLEHFPDSSAAKQGLSETMAASENTLRSILISASSFMATLKQNDKIARMLSYNTFELEDLIKPKTALFIITDDSTTTCDDIVSIIISQIQTYLLDVAYINASKKLNVRTNFVIDEFQSYCIPDMVNSLATHRSRNIRYYLCIQSLAGLKTKYDEPEALLANCGNIFFLGGTEQELLEYIAKMCGTTNFTLNGSERPLVSTSQLAALKKTWDYKQAVFLSPLKSIKFCTNFPSIEAYNIGNYPSVMRTSKIPPITPYTVSQYVSDVFENKVNVAFTGHKLNEISDNKDPGTHRRRYDLLANLFDDE